MLKYFMPKPKHPERFQWEEILGKNSIDWEASIKKAKKGPKILVATSTGGHSAVTPVESLLAAALTLRGADVHFLLCDKFLPACLQATTQNIPPQLLSSKGPQAVLCDGCFAHGMQVYKPLKLPIHLYSDLVTGEELKHLRAVAQSCPFPQILQYRDRGISIGEHAYAGALRYYARGDLENEAYGEAVLRRYFYASLLTAGAIKQLLSNIHFDHAVFHHGIYVPQGIIGEVCRKENVNVVNWSVAYRKNCFIFSHEDTYHHTMLSEPLNVWEDMKWNEETEKKTDEYLKSRWKGTKDWIWFHEKPQFDVSHIEKETGIDFSKKTIGLLTNVIWDAQLHYPANAFPDMVTWLIKTIRYFKKRKDLQLVIRIHPAEVRGTVPSRQRVVDEITKSFPVLPSNVFVISPDSAVSTYAVMAKCNAVIIYGTKTGVELTSMGIPVIVAGEAWVRNKGITQDAKSQKHYFSILDTLPYKKKLTGGEILRAKKYAFHFFFRRMIPVRSIKPSEQSAPYEIAIHSLEDILPGKDPGLDVICNGILAKKEFIFKEEELM